METIKIEKVISEINSEIDLFVCPRSNRQVRVSCHVINRGQNKNNVDIKLFDVNGLSEPVYNSGLLEGKGLTITGIRMKPREKLTIKVSDKTEVSLKALVKGKRNETT